MSTGQGVRFRHDGPERVDAAHPRPPAGTGGPRRAFLDRELRCAVDGPELLHELLERSAPGEEGHREPPHAPARHIHVERLTADRHAHVLVVGLVLEAEGLRGEAKSASRVVGHHRLGPQRPTGLGELRERHRPRELRQRRHHVDLRAVRDEVATAIGVSEREARHHVGQPLVGRGDHRRPKGGQSDLVPELSRDRGLVVGDPEVIVGPRPEPAAPVEGAHLLGREVGAAQSDVALDRVPSRVARWADPIEVRAEAPLLEGTDQRTFGEGPFEGVEASIDGVEGSHRAQVRCGPPRLPSGSCAGDTGFR